MNIEESVQTAVNEFCKAAIEKGDFASPAKRDHKLHAIMGKAVQKLYSLGVPGMDALKSLLKHESKYVRNWIATELLASGDADAKKVLVDLAADSGLVGTGAEIVLNQYKSEELKSPFGIKYA